MSHRAHHDQRQAGLQFCNVYDTVHGARDSALSNLRGRRAAYRWLSDLPDRQAQARILARLERLEFGNFGDSKYVRDGVSELRIDWGPGYRIYFGRDAEMIVLLHSGDKRKQDTDIERAVQLWQEYASRRKHDPHGRR